MEYQIRYGLSGGFGGCQRKEWEDCDSETENKAVQEAWERACEEYDSYAGLHGLRDTEQIIEEDGVSAEEAQEIYVEEREGWLDYEVRISPNNVI